MKKFISKQPIEAIQFTPENYINVGTKEEPKYEFDGIPVRSLFKENFDNDFITVRIDGDEVKVNPKDWLVKDANGKLEIIHKNEHFEEHFEEVK